MRTCTPKPINSIKPERVVAVGQDISVGSRPIASCLLVACGLHLSELKQAFLARIDIATSKHHLRMPDRSVSQAISIDWRAVAQAGLES